MVDGREKQREPKGPRRFVPHRPGERLAGDKNGSSEDFREGGQSSSEENPKFFFSFFWFWGSISEVERGGKAESIL